MPPRVVADSNVIVSALHTPGNPRAVLELARAGEINLYLSPFILREVGRTLTGPKFDWPQPRVTIALLALPGEIIDPGPPHIQAVPHTTDNRILECAIAARAHAIVTGDRHLLQLGGYRHIQIVTPRDFLAAFHTRREGS